MKNFRGISHKLVGSKIFGLKAIAEFGLPHPNWRFLALPPELPAKPWCVAKHGWTVRTGFTCDRVKLGEEIGLPFRNMVPWKQVDGVTKSIAQQTSTDISLIIYPSWESGVSGTIMVKETSIVMEAVEGPIANLTDGKATPTAIIEYDHHRHGRCIKKLGKTDIFRRADDSMFRRFLNVISRSEGVLEWTKTTDGDLFFHQWQISRVSGVIH